MCPPPRIPAFEGVKEIGIEDAITKFFPRRPVGLQPTD
jgi:hypothetical protein